MSRMNCWEFFDCGREAGGKRTIELGVCPVSEKNELDGVNDGKHGGRCCWAIAGTLCEGEVQGSYAQKLGNCLKCDFHAFVRGQQREGYAGTKQILGILKGEITASCLTNSAQENKLKKVV